jgi:hypothetical protein
MVSTKTVNRHALREVEYASKSGVCCAVSFRRDFPEALNKDGFVLHLNYLSMKLRRQLRMLLKAIIAKEARSYVNSLLRPSTSVKSDRSPSSSLYETANFFCLRT